MRTTLYTIIGICLTLIFLRYSVREIHADKKKIWPISYRLFQGTEAWTLAKAVQDEDIIKIKNILREKPELVNLQDSVNGNSLLFISIYDQHYRAFKTMLEMGANVNLINGFGDKPIIEACSWDRCDVKFVKELVKYGADINDSTNYYKDSPLMCAVSSRNKELVSYLIDNHAVINTSNNRKATILGEALIMDEYDIVLQLLENGADYKCSVYYCIDNYGKKTIPMRITEAMRSDIFDIGSKEHRQKMAVVKFLKDRGIDYYKEPIPDYILKRIKKYYPNDWREYIKEY